MEDLITKLIDIQQEYVAGKTEDNDFGGYKYRNIETMLKSLKPLIKKHNLFIYFSDDVSNLGDRYYVTSTVTITDGKELLSASASAREEYEKKKSDASQLTGSASTYARKYALCGLLGVDDGTNDPDSKNNDRDEYKKPTTRKDFPATDKQRSFIKTLLEQRGVKKDDMPGYLEEHYGIIPGETMLVEDAKTIIEDLKG